MKTHQKNNMKLKINTSRENGLRQTGPHAVKSNKSNNGKNEQKVRKYSSLNKQQEDD